MHKEDEDADEEAANPPSRDDDEFSIFTGGAGTADGASVGNVEDPDASMAETNDEAMFQGSPGIAALLANAPLEQQQQIRQEVRALNKREAPAAGAPEIKRRFTSKKANQAGV